MPSGLEQLDQRRLADGYSPGRRFPPSGRRGATALVKFLVIALCCALFLALVVLRG